MFADSLPLLLFVAAGLFSPGPNVVMLTTSGARFGFKRTLPHLLGVPFGTGLLAAASALGVGALLIAAPALKFALQLIAAAWILYLAYKLIIASRVEKSEGGDRPFTFFEAIAFQVVNPKVWAVALAASAGFSIGLPPKAEALRLFIAFCGINLLVCLFWTSVGHLLSTILRNRFIWRAFMSFMAVLMAASALLIFI